MGVTGCLHARRAVGVAGCLHPRRAVGVIGIPPYVPSAVEEVEEDEFYNAVADTAARKRKHKEALYQRDPQMVAEEAVVVGKRDPGWDILTNHGLRPHKKKEYRYFMLKGLVHWCN